MNDDIVGELHKPIKKPAEYKKIVSDFVNNIWSADLCDMSMYADTNDDYKFMLTCIDLNSRYAWAVPMKRKSGNDTKNAIGTVFEDAGTKPNKLWVDQGTEFYNKVVKNFIKPTELYSTFGAHKAVVIERFNRTLKGLMFKHMTKKGTRRWIDMLPLLLDTYNNKVHSSIKMKPSGAYNMTSVSERDITPYPKPKFKVGDKVRVQYKMGKFDKGYFPNYSFEIFTISRVKNGDPNMYFIEDFEGEKQKRAYYDTELVKTKQKEGLYLVESVLKHRTYKGKKQSFVHFTGYSSKHDDWVYDDQIEDIN